MPIFSVWRQNPIKSGWKSNTFGESIKQRLILFIVFSLFSCYSRPSSHLLSNWLIHFTNTFSFSSSSRRLFEEHKELLALFDKFSELKTREAQTQSTELAEHANKVMETLDEGIRSLDELDVFFQYLHNIGASHRRIPGKYTQCNIGYALSLLSFSFLAWSNGCEKFWNWNETRRECLPSEK